MAAGVPIHVLFDAQVRSGRFRLRYRRAQQGVITLSRRPTGPESHA